MRKFFLLNLWRNLSFRLACWKCEHANELKPSTRFCERCSTIQPLSPGVDYFSYLGLERKYDIAQNELKSRFRQIQAHVHPDKYGGEERQVQELSERHSSYLNQAYYTLKKSRLRARYLLKLLTNGAFLFLWQIFARVVLQILDSPQDETNASFAAEMFDFMSELEALNDAQSLRQKAEEIDAQIDALIGQVERAFADMNIQTARSMLNRLRYFDRAKELIEQRL